jgi:hypothetical protein
MNIPCTFISKRDYALIMQDMPIRGHVVRKHFHWNGASIPTWACSIVMLHPFHPKVRRASLLHDWMYCSLQPRKESDIEYRIVCREDGCNIAQAWVMYLFLRLVGWWPYMRIQKLFEKQKNGSR